MIRFLKYRTPFILLAISFICTCCSYFDFYNSAFKYLGDLFGYSILTNIFMLLYYSNRKFCDSTRVAVIGLLSLNVLNILYLKLNVNGGVYDLVLLSFIILIIILLKLQNNDTSN